MLRLGWAYWLKGSPELAQPWLEKAIATSKAPGDWRTRGRAHYDLALIWAKKNNVEKTDAAMKASFLTGYKVKDVDPSLAKAALKLEKLELSIAEGSRDGGVAKKKDKEVPAIVPREVSLFPVDKFGDVTPAATKPPPPEGFMVVHF
jgi:hypothetical protein